LPIDRVTQPPILRVPGLAYVLQPIPKLLSLGDISQRPGVRESGKAPKPVDSTYERVSSVDCSWQAKT